jgi:hypothetical protein
MNKQIAIQAEQITKTFGDFTAVDHISFEVKKGDIIRLSEYVIKENGKYYVINKYFSSYDDDPFKNGLGEESKKILEKEEKWKESNESIWWK